MALAQDEGPHQQLRYRVAEQLRAAILDGRLRAGAWLRQERLAHEYGVSQMPVREALKLLAAEGLVEHVPYRGVRVVAFAPEDVEDLYAHRSYLEGIAAAAAAHAITAEELQALREVQAALRQSLAPEQLAAYRALNRRFHQIVFSASRRPYLTRTLTQIWAAFPTMLWANFLHTADAPLPERDATDIQEHEAIIAALERRDAPEAERLMRHHIATAGQQLAAALRRGPTPDPKT